MHDKLIIFSYKERVKGVVTTIFNLIHTKHFVFIHILCKKNVFFICNHIFILYT